MPDHFWKPLGNLWFENPEEAFKNFKEKVSECLEKIIKKLPSNNA